MGEPSGEPPKQLNVLGLPIELCCQDPVTGFFHGQGLEVGAVSESINYVVCLSPCSVDRITA